MDEISRAAGVSQLQLLLYSSKFFDSMRTGILLQNIDGSVIDYNEASARLLQVEVNQLDKRTSFNPWRDAVREDGSAFLAGELPMALTLKSGETRLDEVMGVNILGQIRRWLSVDTYLLNVDGEVRGVVSAFDDIDSQWHERQMLKLLAEVNRVVISASDEAESFRHLCVTLAVQGPFALAWIGVALDDEDRSIEVIFSAGTTDYLYEGIMSWSENRAIGLGPGGMALRTMLSQVANDVANHPGMVPWRERALEFEFRSCVAIPFAIGDRRAVLCVYAHERFAFDEATVRGLEQIVREVGFGVAYVRSVRQSEAALEETIEAINAQRAAEHALHESERRFRLAFENNMAPMTFTDLDDRIIAVNNAFCEMVGYSREELLGHDSSLFTYHDDVSITKENFRRVTSGESDQMRYTKRYQCKDGRVITSEISSSAARDANGKILYFVFSERDITEEETLTAQLSHQAFHDPLTGLANRALFNDRLAQAHARMLRRDDFAAVLLLDLDDFKGVNDTHGHLIGDQLLVGIARRLELVARSSDTLCRFGGDEFLYLAEGLSSSAEAEAVAKRLLDALALPFVFGEVQVEQRASIGVVVWNAASAEDSEFVRDADVALYEAKAKHRGHYAVFTPSMHQRAVSRYSLVQELRHALHAGELSMHYQPIVDLVTTEIVGFEALMRWQHPERGFIGPDVFIPLAEQSELILELGSFALREAVAAATTWEQPTGRAGRPYVAVNLSARQFYESNLLSSVEEALAASGLEPQRLLLEITESVALYDISETLNSIQRLNHLGIDIALDDFGTGYSSLSYLVLIHPRIIKIDQSFVRPAYESDQNDTLLEAIISLGSKLKMTMLAEGIETAIQLERLRRSGCDLGQGFFFSPAVPAGEVAPMIERLSGYWK